MSNFFQRSGTGRMYQNPSTVQNSDFDITATNIPVAVRDDPTYGTYRKYADGTTQGRVLRSSVVRSAAIALTTATAKTICQITLPVGKWELIGLGGFLSNAATSSTAFEISISKITDTLPGADTIAVWTDGEVRTRDRIPATVGIIDFYAAIPKGVVEVTEPTTYYLVLQASFTVNTCAGFGSMEAISIL